MIKTYPTKSPLPALNKIDSLIWDWNGTLLDDVDVNLKVINKILSRRELKPLDLDKYKDSFCFPVQSFHRSIGLDFEKESIEDISAEYHITYKLYENGIKLNANATFVLDVIQNMGIRQYILSASMKDDLMKMLHYYNLTDKFTGIYGAGDICATGKVDIGKQMMLDHSLNPNNTLIIGDTLHDAEVARSLGVHHLLYSGGHNSYDLLIKKSKVITSLKEILSLS